VSVEKAKGKGKGTAKKSAKKSTPRTKKKGEKPVDMVRVRENISDLVRASAEGITAEVIKAAMTGQLAPAKYLFEAVGLYPATEETEATPVEGSLAHTLLRRMGLPTEPVITEEDLEATVLTSDGKSASDETSRPKVAEEDLGDEHEEQGPHLAVSEE